MSLEGDDVPRVSVTSIDESELEKCTVKFQCGLLRETETFIGEDVHLLCLETLQDYVCDMLHFKYPDHPYGDLYTKLILFKHDNDTNELTLLAADDEISDGMIIEVILRADSKQEYSDTICPHLLRVHTYKTPSFCDHCGVVMFGLLKQGIKCEGCDKNFHKKCAYKIPNDCTRYWAELGTAPPTPRTRETWSGRPLWIDKAIQARPQVPHTLFVHSFKKPTACHHCKKLIKGVFKNGMKCKDCGFNYHKKCAKEIGNNCPGEIPSLSRIDNGEFTTAKNVIANEYITDDTCPDTPPELRNSEELDSTEDISVSSQQDQEEIEDESVVDLPPTMDTIAEEPSGGEDSTSNEGSDHNQAGNVSSGNIQLQRVTGVSMRQTKPLPATVFTEGWMVHYTNKSTIRKKHYWRLDTKCLTFYKSNDSPHYYKEIQLADVLAVDPMINAALYPLSPPHVFELVTSNCTYYVGVDMTGAAPEDLSPPTDIDIMGSNIVGDVSHLTLMELEDLGIGLNVALTWEEALHSALMPVTPQASMGSLSDIGGPINRPQSFRSKRGSLHGSFRGSFHGNHRPNSFRGGSIRAHKGSTRGSFRGSFRAVKPPHIPMRQTQNTLKPKIETKMDVSQFYQIFPEEILGSGQFGTVYGGQNRTTSKTVAVKVIDKLRFPHKHDTALRQEVTILQYLEHPGIICLEQMFETPEKIYIVMEKMNGDMLEMILNSPISRLSERVTKFLIYQILVALQYLHKKDIVHCDLKPENVLLTSETGMPQAKLCDFGFARIIGEKSFRKSIVGTPAYLAPEVLKNEGYNRSLDLWSVGVIVYVSLSGTFPFNEDEEINDQIHNAAFMYPPDPWATVSREAIDFVSKLLQVSRRSRFKTNQAINHVWLNDVKLWQDLCELESKLDTRYLTHESEDTWWIKQGAKPHPLAKKSQRFLHHTYNNITILDEPRPGASPIATTAVIANMPVRREQLTKDSSTTDKQPPVSDNTLVKRNDSIPKLETTESKRKSIVEIVKTEQRALKVGYTVSTV